MSVAAFRPLAMARIEEMCADSWNWQKKNPDGYHTAN